MQVNIYHEPCVKPKFLIAHSCFSRQHKSQGCKFAEVAPKTPLSRSTYCSLWVLSG